MTNVIDVVVTEKDTATKIIDTLHGRDTEALDAPQKIFKGYQIPEMSRVRCNDFFISLFFKKEIETDRWIDRSREGGKREGEGKEGRKEGSRGGRERFRRLESFVALKVLTRLTSTPRYCLSP